MLNNKTAYFKVEKLAKTTFWFSLATFAIPEFCQNIHPHWLLPFLCMFVTHWEDENFST
jgi:hypothetical protein